MGSSFDYCPSHFDIAWPRQGAKYDEIHDLEFSTWADGSGWKRHGAYQPGVDEWGLKNGHIQTEF